MHQVPFQSISFEDERGQRNFNTLDQKFIKACSANSLYIKSKTTLFKLRTTVQVQSECCCFHLCIIDMYTKQYRKGSTILIDV